MKWVAVFALFCFATIPLLSACQMSGMTGPTTWENVIDALQGGNDDEYAQGIIYFAQRQWDAKAKFELGKKMERKNPIEAIKWYRMAAQQGHVVAQFRLGEWYSNLDIRKAEKWYRKAAYHNDPEEEYRDAQLNAQFKLAKLLWRRWKAAKAKNVTDPSIKNLKEVHHLFTMAAIRDHGEAMLDLGILVSYGDGGVTQDFDLAFQLVHKAAYRHFLGRAYYNLGLIFDEQTRVPLNNRKGDREAVRWYRLAAEENKIPDAQYFLGVMYEMGRGGLKKDLAEAYKWYSLAAKFDKSDFHEPELHSKSIDRRNDLIRHSSKSGLNNWYPKRRIRTGSGFYVSQQHILTNKHVVDGCDEVRIPPNQIVTIADKSPDPAVDLALLTARRTDVRAARFRKDSLGIQMGEGVVVVGHPLHGEFSLEPSVTKGNLVSTIGGGNDKNAFRFSAPVQSGNSGGPVLDSSGQAIGVVVAKHRSLRDRGRDGWEVVQNINYAIKGSVALQFIRKTGLIKPDASQFSEDINFESTSYLITDRLASNRQPAGYLFSFPNKNDPEPPHGDLKAGSLDPKKFSFDKPLLGSVKVPFHIVPYYKEKGPAKDMQTPST